MTKAIQHRKAQYYLLKHEYHFTEKLLRKGQIESKEAETLKNVIDEKIFYLQTHPPTIVLQDHITRITFASELSELFTTEELKEHIAKQNETLYHPGEMITG